MNVGYYVSLAMIQNARKWPDIAAQYCACVASRKKDAKLYIAKGSLNVDKTMSAVKMIYIVQDTLLCLLPFTK